MRRKLAAGNWKMNGGSAELPEITALIAAQPDPSCDVLICPPFTLIDRMSQIASGSAVAVGAQDCHANAKGAHTGDTSVAMLADAGASHVILGHSERRADHGETDAEVRAKTTAVLAGALTAIVCVGETLAQREAGETLAVIRGQLQGSVPADAPAELVVAYEPVWAIGTGLTPTLEQIAEVHDDMRAKLVEMLGGPVADEIRLLYGGSVKPSNAAEIFAVSNVDGALVGGASLKAADFGGIVAAASAG